jgi:magnesium transporter
MIRSFAPGLSRPEGLSDEAAGDPIWIDLLDPTEAECSEAGRAMGGPIPNRQSLRQIENSRRLRREGDLLYMSIPAVNAPGTGGFSTTPIGFVLSRDRLVTVRFTELKSFAAVAEGFGSPGHSAPRTAHAVFVRICEELIEVLADRLERISDDLHKVSSEVFHSDASRGRQAVRSSRLLRIHLRAVGRLGDRASAIADSIAGLDRIVPFSLQAFDTTTESELLPRLSEVQQDCASLKDYEARLSNKVQFLLDAMVGLIGIAQGDIFKLLTIVSIVGIPPTFVASMYGMNFKNMPELSWHYGYLWGLALIVVSTLVPLAWFKVKGWF